MCFDDLTLAVDGVVSGGVAALVHLLQARGDVGGGKSHPGSNGSGFPFDPLPLLIAAALTFNFHHFL